MCSPTNKQGINRSKEVSHGNDHKMRSREIASKVTQLRSMLGKTILIFWIGNLREFAWERKSNDYADELDKQKLHIVTCSVEYFVIALQN